MTNKLTAHFSPLSSYNRIVVGYSGGLDSTVLLHLLASVPTLKKNTVAIHVNHGLSPSSQQWIEHAQIFCQKIDVPLKCKTVSIDPMPGESLEEQARIARYGIFKNEVDKKDCLVLAHHQLDQAETVLLQLLRGSGIDGLRGMPLVGKKNHYNLIRPLLSFEKSDLEAYAKTHDLTWIEDESNQNNRFSRNYLRNEIMPALSAHFSKATQRICHTARHCSEASEILNELASPHYERCIDVNQCLLISPLNALTPPYQKLVIRKWFQLHGNRMPSSRQLSTLIKAVVNAREDKTPAMSFDGNRIKRFDGKLYFVSEKHDTPHEHNEIEWLDLAKPLELPDALGYLSISKKNGNLHLPKNPKVTVTFRKGGEKIYLNNCHQKLKKLFQSWSVPPWLRSQIPLIYINGELASIVGHCVSQHYVNSSADCYHITHNSC